MQKSDLNLFIYPLMKITDLNALIYTFDLIRLDNK